MGGTDFKWGDRAPLPPPLATAQVYLFGLSKIPKCTNNFCALFQFIQQQAKILHLSPSLWGLIPKYCDASPNTAQDLERSLKIYQEDIGPRAAVVPEVQRWVNKWKKEDVNTVPSSAIEALLACHADIYPHVYILLTILGALPVSTATSERSFCTMRRLKTYLRSSIGDERMTGLALLSIHKDRQIDREKNMNDFVTSSNRRSDFVL